LAESEPCEHSNPVIISITKPTEPIEIPNLIVDEQLKRRLVGAVVLVALAVIAIPMLVGQRPGADGDRLDVDLPLGELAPFDSRLLRDEIPGPETVIIAPATIVKPFQEQPTEAPKAPPQPPKPVAAAKPPPASPQPKSASDSAHPPQLKAWVIQVGSFSQLDNARDLVTRLRKAGFDTMEPESATVGGKTVFRVQVGPEADRKRAERLVPKIKQVANLTGTVMSYP
jgi:DedD protein